MQILGASTVALRRAHVTPGCEYDVALRASPTRVLAIPATTAKTLLQQGVEG
jgi:hypothetical protein